MEKYSDIREEIEPIKLPPYSPVLNPIEQCWRVTRREVTHNIYFENEKVLKATLDEYFLNIASRTKKCPSYVSLSTDLNVVYYKVKLYHIALTRSIKMFELSGE